MVRKKAIIGNCPGCGYGLGAGDYECPQCGRAIFLDASKDPDVAIAQIRAKTSVENTRVNRGTDLEIVREQQKTERKKNGIDTKLILFVTLGILIFIGLCFVLSTVFSNKSEKETEQLISDIQTAIDSGDYQKAEDLLVKLKTGGDSDYRKEMYKTLKDRLDKKKKDSSRVILLEPICIFAA